MSHQTNLNGKRIIPLCVNNAKVLWDYQAKEMDNTKAEERQYPPAVFLRKSKKGTTYYGFVPDGGIPDKRTLVVGRQDLIDLLRGKNAKGEPVEFAKMGVMEPSSNSSTAEDTKDDMEGLQVI